QQTNRDGVQSLTIGDLDVPVDGHGKVLVNYLGPPFHTFTNVSATDVMHGRVPREALAGRIALVGFTAPGIVDTVVTPFASVSPRIEVRATLIDTPLPRGSLHRLWWFILAEVAFILAIGAVLGWVLHRFRGAAGAVLAILLAGGY